MKIELFALRKKYKMRFLLKNLRSGESLLYNSPVVRDNKMTI